MKPKVIKSDRDHQAALAYVDRLMDQPSPDDDELELWSLLAGSFEALYRRWVPTGAV